MATTGNLSSHVTKLEKAGYVTVESSSSTRFPPPSIA